MQTAAAALVSTRLGGIDADVLRTAGLGAADVQAVIGHALEIASAPLPESLMSALRHAVLNPLTDRDPGLPFVEKLARQPRSGATKPGAPRLFFDAPESHADHSLGVAVTGVLLAHHYGADSGIVFLTGLCHHFHNADLPDAGFAGEEALGPLLDTVFGNLRNRVLQELPPHLHDQIRHTFTLLPSADARESKAFHAADVLDRVLQQKHHADAAAFTLAHAMDELELVHAGPVQSFHHHTLREAGLMP